MKPLRLVLVDDEGTALESWGLGVVKDDEDPRCDELDIQIYERERFALADLQEVVDKINSVLKSKT